MLKALSPTHHVTPSLDSVAVGMQAYPGEPATRVRATRKVRPITFAQVRRSLPVRTDWNRVIALKIYHFIVFAF